MFCNINHVLDIHLSSPFTIQYIVHPLESKLLLLSLLAVVLSKPGLPSTTLARTHRQYVVVGVAGVHVTGHHQHRVSVVLPGVQWSPVADLVLRRNFRTHAVPILQVKFSIFHPRRHYVGTVHSAITREPEAQPTSRASMNLPHHLLKGRMCSSSSLSLSLSLSLSVYKGCPMS